MFLILVLISSQFLISFTNKFEKKDCTTIYLCAQLRMQVISKLHHFQTQCCSPNWSYCLLQILL